MTAFLLPFCPLDLENCMTVCMGYTAMTLRRRAGKRRLWRTEHPEFEQIVFHGLRHSSATYQLLQSDGDFKSVQGNTGHATASVLMDTYAHTQDKPRLELTEKIEANFYSQDLTPAAPQPRQNEKPAATKISGKEILEAIRLMDADERRELTRALFA